MAGDAQMLSGTWFKAVTERLRVVPVETRQGHPPCPRHALPWQRLTAKQTGMLVLLFYFFHKTGNLQISFGW